MSKMFQKLVLKRDNAIYLSIHNGVLMYHTVLSYSQNMFNLNEKFLLYCRDLSNVDKITKHNKHIRFVVG